jgi:hypothetical protein
MTSTALLKTYREVRDVVGEIHQAAAAVDEHVGRFQVYGDHEQMDHALAEAERLLVNLRRLKLGLRRCLHGPLRNKPSAKSSVAERRPLPHGEAAA